MKRVGMVIGQLTYGGAERQLYEACTRLPQHGIDPIVYCLSENTEPYRELLESKGIQVRTFSRSSHFDVKRGWALRKRIREDRIDLLHSWLIDDNPYAWMATVGTRLRFIASLRSRPTRRDPLRKRIDRFVFNSAQCVLANSLEVRDFLVEEFRIEEKRIEVIENGIDLDRLMPARSKAEVRKKNGTPLEDFLVLFVGRLDKVKRADFLLESFSFAIKERPNMSLWMVGEGPMKEELANLAANLEIDEKVHFLGTRSDVGDLYHAADLFALCSETEGLPNVVVESMACGTPVLLSGGANCSDLVTNGENGWICDEMTIDRFSSLLVGIVDTPQNRSAAGEAARESSRERFSIEKMLKNLKKMYLEVE
ncbi:MAG: glycosyltransferase [Candidatus Omnitrophica bacterium]|nr:glycosyltransferase [Candidatus Omnitrophota bacterium]